VGEFEQDVKFFLKNVVNVHPCACDLWHRCACDCVNEFICAHGKLFQSCRYEGLKRQSVVKVRNACLYMGTKGACPRDGVNL